MGIARRSTNPNTDWPGTESSTGRRRSVVRPRQRLALLARRRSKIHVEATGKRLAANADSSSSSFRHLFRRLSNRRKEINIMGHKLHSLEHCDNISMNPGIVLV